MPETELHVMVDSQMVATIPVRDDQTVTLVLVRRSRISILTELIEQRFPYVLLRKKRGMQMQGVE